MDSCRWSECNPKRSSHMANLRQWSFNDPDTATYNAYSDMVSSQANRRAFIQSLISFMDTYGFQGADIDWEYPAEAKRGGRKEDTDNLVLLMKEMKEQFGGRYGSSLTIAPDYWYLRGFKPAEMQDFVDWVGFMAYDLHGPWDTDVKTLGSRVRPQTDITEIDKNLKPLWFDGVNPSKVVMGIAYYGRTYTLSDSTCGKMGCSFISGEGGAGGSCTQFRGILSNREIKQIIKDETITPYLNETAMVKYFTYQGNSWVGYDDAETYALKEAYANDRCIGGIMIWSIDFDDETGAGLGNGNDYKSPESATIIPMVHTTVPARQTFTLNQGAATDVPRLPNAGDQNSPQGPPNCQQCSFFRLVTSTCCGNGGSVGNPILIPAGVATPMDIPLPAGFTPPQSFTDLNGAIIPANQPLPRETIIPQGTTFTQPFVIGPGMSLRQGEGDDQSANSSNLVWLSPEIWDSPNPQVQCFFPCTFVIPPYTSYTTTVDYPRITVSESGTPRTTITFPPLTVSTWAPRTVVVEGRVGCTGDNTASTCTNTDQNRRTSTIGISRSTTWPPVTWTESGTVRTTRPPGPSKTTNPDPNPTNNPGGGGDPDDDPNCLWPLCPPPPPPIRLPQLTINWGSPKPTTTACAWPTLTCLPPGSDPSQIPGGGGDPSRPPGAIPVDTDPEDEEDEEDACSLPQKTTKTVGVTVTATSEQTSWVPVSTTTTAPDPPKKTPDFSKDVVKCYDSGQWTRRARMITAGDQFCELSLKGHTLWEKWNPGEVKKTFMRVDNEVVGVEILAYVEAKDGCAWNVDVNQCKAVMRKIIDECDTKGENRKQGGRIEGDCLNWRLDPNSDL
jgi:chitinase